MTYKHSIYNKDEKGFTLIEIIIVIVIMGILVGLIAIAYSGIQRSAQTAQAKQDLDDIYKALNIYRVRNGVYPATLAEAGITQNTQGTTYQYAPTSSNGTSTYCITGTNGTVSYKLESSSSKAVEGGCPGHGINGNPPLTNLVSNPGVEVSTSGYTCYNCTVARDTTWNASGSASFSITPTGASNDSFVTIGGDLGAFRTGLQAGKTYTISGTVRLTGAQTGTLNGNGSRQVTAWYTNGGHTVVRGSQASNSAGQQRVSVTYTIPGTATAAWIRLYNGASSGNGVVWWDNIMITEGSTLYNYADGSSTNWIWNGTANSSTSTGPIL